MKKKIIEIFNNNIVYVYYGRSGIIYKTMDAEEIYYLTQKGWKYNKVDSVSPPAVTICDICDTEKIMQYENAQFNLAYYFFLKDIQKKKMLRDYIEYIISKKSIYYKDFYYHISSGPILENSIRIKGIDNRIYMLKNDLVKGFKNSEKYEYYMMLVKELIKDDTKIEFKEISVENKKNREIDTYYKWLKDINKSINYNIDIKINSIKLDKTAMNEINYDYIMLVPNGCYKYIDMFIKEDDINKIFYCEIHADNQARGKHFINNVDLKNKKVLIIDSAFSGNTLQQAKQIVEEKGGNPVLLGIYPKSRNIINVLNYALIGNKVYKREELDLLNENMFVNLYIENLKRE